MESKKIGNNDGERLISQSLMVSTIADIDIETVSCDSVGQLSSDLFNPQEYGCDSPV